MSLQPPLVLPAVPRVLLVSDDTIQLKLGKLKLLGAGFDAETASSVDEALVKARLRTPDAIMSDALVGNIDGFGLCRLLKQESKLATVPVILISTYYQGDSGQRLADRVGAVMVLHTPDFNAELDALNRSLTTLSKRSLELYKTPERQPERVNSRHYTTSLGKGRGNAERYRTLFEQANDTITILSLDGTILEANHAWRKILGISPEQMVGHHIREYAAPGYESQNVEGFHRSVTRGGGREETVPIRRADGRIIYMEFSVTITQVEGEALVFAVGHDVTKRIKALQSLAAAEAKYRALVERMPDVVWTMNHDGRYILLSANVREMSGFSKSDISTGGSALWLQRVHAGDVERVKIAYKSLRQEQKFFDLEYRWQRKDHKWIWVRDRAIAAYDHDGVRHFDGMFSDVTERRALKEGLRQTQGGN